MLKTKVTVHPGAYENMNLQVHKDISVNSSLQSLTLSVRSSCDVSETGRGQCVCFSWGVKSFFF